MVTADPFNLKKLRTLVEEETAAQEPSVLITRHPCVLLTREHQEPPLVSEDLCTGCRTCLRLGCPALNFSDEKACVNRTICNGCGLCLQLCRFHAIQQEAAQKEET